MLYDVAQTIIPPLDWRYGVAMIELSWVGPLALCQQEISRIPAGVPGVYLLCAHEPVIGIYRAVYAGETLDLRRRIAEHLAESAKPSVMHIRRRKRMYFAAAPVRVQLLAATEANLIRTLQPVCNQQVPEAAPVLVNLPPLAVPMLTRRIARW